MSTTTVGTTEDDDDGPSGDPLAVLNDTGEPGLLRGMLEYLGIDVDRIDDLPKWNVYGEIDSSEFH
jgi:hypothetical protein